MSKKKHFFDHDFSAREDEKIVALRMDMGAAGYGIYFMLLELLSESSGYMLESNYNRIGYQLHENPEDIKKIVEEYGLFQFSDDKKMFFSKRLKVKLENIFSLSDVRSKAGKAGAQSRWRSGTTTSVIKSDSKNIANAINSDSKSITSVIDSDSKVIANVTDLDSRIDNIRLDKKIIDDKEKEILQSSSPSSSFDTSPKDPYTRQSKERKVALKERKLEEPMHIPSYVRKAYNMETEEQYCDTLLNDEKYLTDTAITTNVPLYKIKEYVPIFIAHCRATEASHRSSGDFKSHFINYINKKEHNGKEQSKPSPLSTAERLRKDVDISNFRAEDYGKP